MRTPKHSSILKACVMCAFLIPGMLLPGAAAGGGFLQNDTDSTGILIAPRIEFPPHSKTCIREVVEVPTFVVDKLICHVPFYTSRTTVRLYYDASGKATCCRDCIPNPCAGAETAVEATPAMDTDRDGLILRAEFLESLKEGFQLADRNRDGVLSHEEMSYAEDTKMPMDHNGDGGISLSEAVKTMLRLFDDSDADGNGVLTADEFGAE